MYKLFGSDFKFQATHYEEWIGGQCVSRGEIDTLIKADVANERILFVLDNTYDLEIDKRVVMPLATSGELSDNRIQYAREWDSESSTLPIVCHVFIKENQAIDYVRFAMTNPDRLIEFYGQEVEDKNKERRYEHKMLIETLTHIQNQFRAIAERKGNIEMAQMSIQMVEMYKNALLVAWQEFQFGWHSDFWKEGQSMFEYDMVECNLKNILPKLITSLQTESIFRHIEKDGYITKSLIEIYQKLLYIVENGGLKHC